MSFILLIVFYKTDRKTTHAGGTRNNALAWFKKKKEKVLRERKYSRFSYPYPRCVSAQNSEDVARPSATPADAGSFYRPDRPREATFPRASWGRHPSSSRALLRATDSGRSSVLEGSGNVHCAPRGRGRGLEDSVSIISVA